MSSQSAHLLVAHGSSNTRWRTPFEKVAKALEAQHPERTVRLCYLEKWQPDVTTALEELYQQGWRRLRLSPLFLSRGRHLETDLPEILKAYLERRPDFLIRTEDALGEQSDFVQALTDILA